MTVIALFYIAFTVIGLRPFKGIPIANIALGFLLGALIIRRFEAKNRLLISQAGEAPNHQAADLVRLYYQNLLRDLVSWAIMAAGVTMVICWTQLIGAILIPRSLQLGPVVADWIFLISPSDSLLEFRTRLFAMLISPGLQILTTVFGGVVAVLFTHKKA